MKKSGTFLTWALFGIAAESLYVVSLVAFGVKDGFALSSLFFSALFFVALRLLMDWNIQDNALEDYVRETVISDKPTDRLVFAFIGGLLLALSNPGVFGFGSKLFLLAMLSTYLTQSCFESAREVYNAYRFKKSPERAQRGVTEWQKLTT